MQLLLLGIVLGSLYLGVALGVATRLKEDLLTKLIVGIAWPVCFGFLIAVKLDEAGPPKEK